MLKNLEKYKIKYQNNHDYSDNPCPFIHKCYYLELSEKEKRLAKDYQLQRALDLIKGLSIFEESFEE